MEGKLGGGISEVRRLHIIYFLSHMGRAEQPHLIRIHHLTRSGVYLRGEIFIYLYLNIIIKTNAICID